MRSIARVTMILFLWPLCIARADEDSRIPGWTPGAYSLACGVWEEVGEVVKNQRYDHRYSWGTSKVIPN